MDLAKFKTKSKIRYGGTCLKSQLLIRQRAGGLWFEVSLSKKLVKLHFNKFSMVVHICISAIQEELVGGSWSQGGPRQKVRPYLKSNLKVKRAGSMA
jgi:hypothetical protein